ncbi:1-phosphofructokinase family hexose kinase [Paenibacillus validus]|nr:MULTISPECIES: 1-phosphofructokinase family hexose kinase [Paenibacillus]MED4602222.1 1-phosphofructokinase family hexose kinase [Paenibacillus validus]MED4607388.1 1-phosphofructokinase family hexose kinase [Paenibacillus validus]
MITTITLNAAIDKVHYIERFRINSVNRVAEIAAEPGGKGNNVAKVARLLGSDVTASGFLGGDTGRFVDQQLRARGIASDPVWVTGQTREAFNIIDQSLGTQTEILEPGPEISAVEWQEMKVKVKDLAAKSSVISFSGSLPRGLQIHAYAELIQAAKEAGALTILDSSGESLRAAIESAPFLLKPNRDELAQLTGQRADSAESVIHMARTLIAQGISWVVVSLDKDGSLVVSENQAWQVLPPVIDAVNTVGCGDALVGGTANFLDLLGDKPAASSMIEAVAWGTAAAASNALYPIAGHVHAAGMQEMLRQVTVKPL